MKTITFMTFVLLIGLNLLGQTNFQGGIYSNTSWTKDKSPYIITGDVVIFPGKVLTIEPGVEIRFAGHYSFEVRGILESNGTAELPISFTSNLASPKKGDWIGLIIKSRQEPRIICNHTNFYYADVANDNIDGNPLVGTFSNCKFENNNTAIRGNYFSNSLNSFDNCVFSNNTYCINNVMVHDIKNSTFINNEFGIYECVWVTISKSVFENNTIAIYAGVCNIDNCVVTNNSIGIINPLLMENAITNNIISSNSVGIQYSNSRPETRIITASNINNLSSPKYNMISNNSDYNVENLTDGTKDLTDNYWDTSDSTTIENRLKDGYDDIKLGLINFDIFDNNKAKIKSVIKAELITSDPFAFNTNDIIKIYPNPFLSELNINFKQSDFDNVNVSIYNTSGQKIYSAKSNGDNLRLNLDNINSGVYILVIQSNSNVIKKKIIKK